MSLASRMVGLDVDDLEQWKQFRAEYEVPPTMLSRPAVMAEACTGCSCGRITRPRTR